ncbi:MAG TPA: hypothetical protein VMS94_06735 [Acidobacteriota bacterium]|nr:hypothetical protein [Acidobacteriota bacterium]
MKELKPCVICGEMTNKFLFKDKTLGIPLCSSKCEYQYLQNLTPDRKEQMNVVRVLDQLIEENKKLNKTIWGIAGVGLIPIFIGVRLANPTIFLIGVAVVSIAALMTRHFDERIEELTKQRKRIAI